MILIYSYKITYDQSEIFNKLFKCGLLVYHTSFSVEIQTLTFLGTLHKTHKMKIHLIDFLLFLYYCIYLNTVINRA